MADGMTIVKFLDLIGWGEWFKSYAECDKDLLTFPDVVFGTLPFMLQLFFIIFLLNWIMGMIGDVTKIIAKGGHI